MHRQIWFGILNEIGSFIMCAILNAEKICIHMHSAHMVQKRKCCSHTVGAQLRIICIKLWKTYFFSHRIRPIGIAARRIFFISLVSALDTRIRCNGNSSKFVLFLIKLNYSFYRFLPSSNRQLYLPVLFYLFNISANGCRKKMQR